MKRISILLFSCSLFASDLEFHPDPTTKGIEYAVKPNGVTIYRPQMARVPPKQEHKEPQVLNPDFLCDCPIQEEKQEPETEKPKKEEK